MRRVAADAFNLLNGRDELITALRKSSNITGPCRIVIECEANLSNTKVQPAIEIDERFGAPNCFAQFLSGHCLTGASNEARKHLRRLRLQADENALTSEFFCGEVKFKKAESKSSYIHHPPQDCRTGRRPRTDFAGGFGAPERCREILFAPRQGTRAGRLEGHLAHEILEARLGTERL